jgi:Mrp family chromosome partitioning ATPase
MLLADMSDGVICVVRSAFTDLASAQKSCQQLQQKGLLGIVLNCADEGASYGSYYSSLPARVLDGSAA